MPREKKQDQILREAFLNVYHARLAWVNAFTESYFAMNRSSGVGQGSNYQYFSADNQLVPEYENKKKTTEAANEAYETAKKSLLSLATELQITEEIVHGILKESFQKASTVYETNGDSFRAMNLSDLDGSNWYEMNQYYRNTAHYIKPISNETKVKVLDAFRNTISLYIDAGKANPDQYCSKISSAKVLDAFENTISLYIEARQANPNQYYSKFSSLFSHLSKDVKLKAAEKIRDYKMGDGNFQITKAEYKALCQGKLYDSVKDKLREIKDQGKLEIAEEDSNKPKI